MSLAQIFLLLCSCDKLSQVKGKCGATHKATKTVYIRKRLTLKKYATTRRIAHITIYNKHKHNHHYSHDTSSSLELSQSMPKLISATGSYWCGRILVAVPTFWANLSGVLCTETVAATMPVAVESYRDVTISL